MKSWREILHLILSSAVFNDSKWIDTAMANYVALGLAGLSILFSAIHIVRHLKNYTMPQIQVYVIRILFTCPVYAITSSAALLLGQYGTYAEVIRDMYEPFVIYSFLNLILEYSGGETDCVYLIENEPPLKMPCPLCLMKPKQRNTKLMRFCNRGVLQFIVTKPIVAVMDILMLAVGLYYNKIYEFLVMAVYNISYGWALYCLFVFYLATKPIIKNFKPIAKFSTVKIIIFATYYQSMVLKLTLSSPQYAIRWNDFLLCAEMVLFSLLLMLAFPVKEFMGGIPDRRVLQNVKEVFTVRDIYQDVCNNFNNKYRDYALQRSENETPATVNMQEYFHKNMNPVAIQMNERYRGKSKKFAFNSLLRGTRPVKAGLRRSNQFTSGNSSISSSSGGGRVSGGGSGDVYQIVEEGNSRAVSPALQDESGDEADTQNDDDGRIHDAEEGYSGDEAPDIIERRGILTSSSGAGKQHVHIGRLTLASKKKSPTITTSATTATRGGYMGSSKQGHDLPKTDSIGNVEMGESKDNAHDVFSPLIRSPSSISDDQVLTSSSPLSAAAHNETATATVEDNGTTIITASEVLQSTPLVVKRGSRLLERTPSDWGDFVEAR